MTNSATNDQSPPAMAFFGKMLTFSRIQLITNDLHAIDAQLATMLSNKTSNMPVIIDSDIEQDLPALTELLWSWGLQPIGVVKGLLEDQARIQRLAIFPGDGKRIERIISTQKSAVQLQSNTANSKEAHSSDNDNSISANNSANIQAGANEDSNASPAIATSSETIISTEQITSLIYDQMLRSGQSLNHVGGDLILTNSINSGAEAITDNSLHVYGRAQGRLVAGATGDKDARIFCQVFNPSLVSVAGTYCLRDNLPEGIIDKAVQVRFIEGEGLVFKVMEDI